MYLNGGYNMAVVDYSTPGKNSKGCLSVVQALTHVND
jgi:hypothetical protein